MPKLSLLLASIASISAIITFAGPARALDPEQPNAVVITTLLSPHELGIGMRYTRDLGPVFRLGVAAGGLAIGSAQFDWQQADVGFRLLGHERPAGAGKFHPSLFANVGFGRFYRETEANERSGERTSLNALAMLELDLTYFGRTRGGFTTRAAFGAMKPLQQEIKENSFVEPYTLSWVGGLAAGYSF